MYIINKIIANRLTSTYILCISIWFIIYKATTTILNDSQRFNDSVHSINIKKMIRNLVAIAVVFGLCNCQSKQINFKFVLLIVLHECDKKNWNSNFRCW